MASLRKSKIFTTAKPRAETQMDKTTRAAREILDVESERREIKTARLSKARLERKVSPLAEAIAPATNGAQMKP